MTEERRTIAEWGPLLGYVVMDPDGFDRTDPLLMERTFTREEFEQGAIGSTCMGVPDTRCCCESAGSDLCPVHHPENFACPKCEQAHPDWRPCAVRTCRCSGTEHTYGADGCTWQALALAKTRRLTFGIDFDGTLAEDPSVFAAMINALRTAHTCVLISQRTEHWRPMIESLLAAHDIDIPVLLVGGQTKADGAYSRGYVVDVWIDDNPSSIESALTYRYLPNGSELQ